MGRRIRLLILAAIGLVGGCSDDHDSVSLAELPATSLPGVYSGVFPCEGCPGIPTTLWLRSDGRFFIEQRYPAAEVRESMNTHSLGRWTWIADDRAMALKGSGPGRMFNRLDADTLVMRTDSDLEHRLTRDPTAPDFSATIRMVGMVHMRDGNAWFTECLTGFVGPVSKAGDFARFRHQYRSASGQGQPAYVELEGRFYWARDGSLRSLTIERFITVKAEGAC